MKLFLIEQHENGGYDCYDSAVVAAENEDIAKGIDPRDGGTMVFDKSWLGSHWCSDIEFVIVEYLGEAKEGTERGVICASFNAG